MHNVAMIGPPGSGKSTLAQLLAAELGFALVSSGDIARTLGEEDRSIAIALKAGAAAPEQLMRDRTQDVLEKLAIEGQGWVLDGFPRNREQLLCIVQWMKVPPIFVNLNVEEITCANRLIHRGREDDHPDSIVRRLDSHQTQTAPMIEWLRPSRQFVEIHSEYGHPDETSVLRLLEDRSAELVRDNIGF